MKELAGHSANMVLAETTKGKLFALVEVILLVSEPKYKQNEFTPFVKTRELSDVRFSTDVNGLRTLSKQFGEMANEAEELERRASIQAPQEV